MAKIEILPDSHPTMRKTCRKVTHVNDDLRKLVEDMYETMVDSFGIGLAAPQVGVTKRFFIYEVPKRDIKCADGDSEASDEDEIQAESEVVDEPDEIDIEPEAEGESEEEETEEEANWGYTGDFTVCINPKIIAREGIVIDDEGCLSKDGWIGKVERAYQVTFTAYDLDMNKFEKTVTGLEARCIQHETDHLDGILFTDRAVPGSVKELSEIDFDEEADGDDGEGDEESGVSTVEIVEDTEESTEDSPVATDS